MPWACARLTHAYPATVAQATEAERAQALALEWFDKALAKSVGAGMKLDMLFSIIRIGFFFRDMSLTATTIERARVYALHDPEGGGGGGGWDESSDLRGRGSLGTHLNVRPSMIG